MDRFLAELLRRAPGTRSGGIAPGDPKQGGYHNSRTKLYALGKTGDYSLRHPWDVRGNPDRWRAVDWVFPDAQGGNYTTIRRYMTRIRDAFARRDPLLTGWREALGQQDADSNPEGFDFVGWYERQPDMTHMWHIHLSIMNEFVDEEWAYDNMLNILFGEVEDVNADQDRQLRSAEFRLHHLFQLDDTVEGDPFGGTYEIKLVQLLRRLDARTESADARLAVLEARLDELANRPTGGVSLADHEAVMRKILGAADGAVPPA